MAYITIFNEATNNNVTHKNRVYVVRTIAKEQGDIPPRRASGRSQANVFSYGK